MYRKHILLPSAAGSDHRAIKVEQTIRYNCGSSQSSGALLGGAVSLWRKGEFRRPPTLKEAVVKKNLPAHSWRTWSKSPMGTFGCSHFPLRYDRVYSHPKTSWTETTERNLWGRDWWRLNVFNMHFPVYPVVIVRNFANSEILTATKLLS